jgi:hypothetical protein
MEDHSVCSFAVVSLGNRMVSAITLSLKMSYSTHIRYQVVLCLNRAFVIDRNRPITPDIHQLHRVERQSEQPLG